MKNIVVFASGSGSNAERLVRYFRQEEHASAASVRAIFCNNPGAYVLERARQLEVPSVIITRDQFADPLHLIPLCRQYGADVIVLAGFLWKIPEWLIAAYEGRILNLHPALLPKYGGKGMYGHHVHEAVIAAGEQRSGITVHIVDARYDHGTPLVQASCPVFPQDSPESLASRIHHLEYCFLPVTVEHFCLSL